MELDDGSLAEMIEDPENPARTKLAVWKNFEVQYVDKLEYHDQILVPLPRNTEMLRRVPLPRGALPYDCLEDLLTRLRATILRCVDLKDSDVSALAHFVLATWFIDRLPVAPYVSLIGLPQSGKTTLLKTLSLVCRRSLLIADITSMAFYEACAQLTPTLLIDETGTHESQRALRHLLRMGSTRDVVAMRKNRSFHAYGAKVLCWTEPPEDAALNSRCIVIPMKETNRWDLAKPTDPEVEQLAADLQKSLLGYRLQHYKSIRLPSLPASRKLRPRLRDILMSLAAPCWYDGASCMWLYHYISEQNRVHREPLPPVQTAVLRALFVLAHQSSGYAFPGVADLTFLVNELLAQSGERLHLQARRVGAALTSLGFTNRERTSRGWKVMLHNEDYGRIHELARIYGVGGLNVDDLPVPPSNCWLCKEREGKR